MKSNILQNRLNKIAVLSKTGDVTQEVIQRLISEEQTQQQKIKERAQTDINPIQLLNDTLSQYSRQTEQVKMPWWLPPTIKEAIEPFTPKYQAEMLRHSFTTISQLGKVVYKKPSEQPQEKDFMYSVVTHMFSQNDYNLHQIKTQEQMLRQLDLLEVEYTLNINQYGHPMPPVDIKAPLLILYQILTAEHNLPTEIIPFLLSARVCDIIECSFWLTHSVVFKDAETSVKYDGEYINEKIPEHIHVRSGLSAQDYLTNRLADDFATIQRHWVSCQSSLRSLILEILPYIVARCVHLGFIRTFPSYGHVFSQQFTDNLYYNLVYAMTGVVPYPDVMKNYLKFYFGELIEFQSSIFQNHIPSGSQLFGDPVAKVKQPVTGPYVTEQNKHLDEKEFHEFLEDRSAGMNQHSRAALVKPVTFDFILFKEVGVMDNKFVLGQEARRNYHQKQDPKSLTSDQKKHLLYQTNFSNIEPQATSVMDTMRIEAARVQRYQAPRSTLKQLQDSVKTEHQLKQAKLETQLKAQQEAEQAKKDKAQSAYGTYELEQVIVPSQKYTNLDQYDPVIKALFLKETKTQDSEEKKKVEIKLMKLTQDLRESQLQTTQQNATVDDKFIIRLPQKYHKFDADSTQVVEVYDQQIVTNNDIVLDQQDEKYQQIINGALKEARSMATQLQQERHHQVKHAVKQEQVETIDDAPLIQEPDIAPIRLSSQTMSITQVCPLMARYLRISGAPAPSDCYSLIKNQGNSQMTTTFFQDKQMRLKNASQPRAIISPVRNLATIQRTRTDCWTDQKRIPVEQRQSPNNFMDVYDQKIKELDEQTNQVHKQIEEDLKDIEIQKALFLDNNLKGKQSRVAVLSKTITEKQIIDLEAIQGQKTMVEMKTKLKDKLKVVEQREKIADLHKSKMPKKVVQTKEINKKEIK
ncbi:Conserved_hypothetical protein [Hexamita inflata]|uniref:Uncharacterized protein n=1 Tax=Hexamita inflata TaxID=28002 RepID=A0AA86NXS9_9EUKA|nr:Conserved hypothetical protein [Hexamita inflata]